MGAGDVVLFKADADGVSASRSSSSSRDGDGLVRLTAPAAEPTRAVLTSSLDRCVPRSYGLRARVRVDRR